MKKDLLEQVKNDYSKRNENYEYDLLYRIWETVPSSFGNKLRYDDETYKLYIETNEIGALGEVDNVAEVDNHIGYYQLRNLAEIEFIKYNDMEEIIATRKLIFNSNDTYELKDWNYDVLESDVVETVIDDFNKYRYRFEDNDYSSIYMLVEKLDEWNSYDCYIEYKVDIKDEDSEDYYLYLEDTKICPMDILQNCYIQEDTVVYQLKDDKKLYIVVRVIEGKANINQIYIENEFNEEDCEMLYELDEDITPLEADDMPL